LGFLFLLDSLSRFFIGIKSELKARTNRYFISFLLAPAGEKGNINTSIGNLVKKGLSDKIQKALDVVRVVGNESVHPGQIDLRDNSNTTSKLFSLVNIISDTMIPQPKEIDALYDEVIPEGKKEAIERRDNS